MHAVEHDSRFNKNRRIEGNDNRLLTIGCGRVAKNRIGHSTADHETSLTTSQDISRILSPVAGALSICLREPKLPPHRSVAQHTRNLKDGSPSSLFCLAPDGVLSCHDGYPPRGGLLTRHFTLTFRSKPSGGIFSVTLAVTGHYSRWPPLSRGILPYGVRTFPLVLTFKEQRTTSCEAIIRQDVALIPSH